MCTTHKVTVEITQKHIDESLYDDFDMNPISLAIESVFKTPCKLRGLSKTLRLWYINTFVPFTPEIERLYNAHLKGELVPCSFELEIPLEWLQVTIDSSRLP